MNEKELFTEMQDNLQAAKQIQTTLSDRYTAAYETYRGNLPLVMKEGDLPASRVMWQAFESIYPTLLKVFTDSKRSPVKFDSDAPQNSKLAAAMTKAVHAAAMGVNGVYKIYMKAIKEILIAGNQVALVGYDTKTRKTEKFNFKAAPLAQLVAQTAILTKAGYSINQDITIDDEEKTATGWIQAEHVFKFPVISLVSFKNFYLHPAAMDVETSRYTAYTEEITIAEGVECGYSESKLLKADNDALISKAGLEKQLFVVNDMTTKLSGADSILSEHNDVITIQHHYWRGCYQSKEPKLYYVVTTDTEVLEVKEVDYCPLVLGGMSIVTDSAWSESLYDICNASQVSKTRAMRAIQRTADGAAYGEYEFIPRQMEKEGMAAFNARGAGGAYAVKSPNTITKLPVNDVSNATQILSNEISQDAQATIQGSAGQAQALEENSNASGTAIALTQDKQELNENQIANCIAETFIKPMYKILLLVLQEMGNTVEIDSDHIPLKLLRSDLGMSIDVEDAYSAAKAATNVKQAYENAVQLGTLPKNFTPENAYNIYADYFRVATGQEDVSRYITAPDKMPQPSKEEQLVNAVLTVAKVRGEIAATQLAEAKVEDMKADAQKKWNDAAYDLAKIKEIFEKLDIEKVKVALEAEQQKNDAANALTQNAQSQEQIDNKQE